MGGDDVPEQERIEIWEKPAKTKRRDEPLDNVLRAAMDKALGREKSVPVPAPVIEKPVAVEAKALPVEYDEEDEEETLLMML